MLVQQPMIACYLPCGASRGCGGGIQGKQVRREMVYLSNMEIRTSLLEDLGLTWAGARMVWILHLLDRSERVADALASQYFLTEMCSRLGEVVEDQILRAI